MLLDRVPMLKEQTSLNGEIPKDLYHLTRPIKVIISTNFFNSSKLQSVNKD